MCGEGGLEVWDKRRPGRPQLRSPLSWGVTGSPALDASQARTVQTMFILLVSSISAWSDAPFDCMIQRREGTADAHVA